MSNDKEYKSRADEILLEMAGTIGGMDARITNLEINQTELGDEIRMGNSAIYEMRADLSELCGKVKGRHNRLMTLILALPVVGGVIGWAVEYFKPFH